MAFLAALVAGSASQAGEHWAFLKPVRPSIPAVRHADWPRSPVDCFILARLEEKGLEPSPPADRRTLIRRVTLDLIGLPPTREEVESFERDTAPDAYERLVDRLLASPHHGERWGRYWLDVARYADTKGYVYGDREERRFVHSHVYRDWVVRSFNQDLPYDRFLLEQIAADQLEAPEDPGHLAAMGFLTLGRRFLGVIHDIIDDRIDTLMRGTQGLTVACARCHDHKFDPIPTIDYYSLYGVFQGSSEKMVPLEPERGTEAYETELRKRVAALEGKFQAKKEELTNRLREKAGEYLSQVLNVEKLPSEEFYAFLTPDDVNPVVVRQWHSYLFQSRSSLPRVFGAWHAFADLPREEFAARASAAFARVADGLNPVVRSAFEASTPAQMSDVARIYGEVLARVESEWRAVIAQAAAAKTAAPASLPDPDAEEIRAVLHGPDSPASVPTGPVTEIEWIFDEASRVELGKLSASIEAWRIDSPGAPPHAVLLVDRAIQRNVRVFLRGNPAQKGVEAPRRFLTVVAGPDRKPFERGSGRLELARAIASRENPLTARVMVNRLWLHHFGAGLVRTPSDFGVRADPPSHPELLDYLSVELMDRGWSLKELHRALVLSSAYQQSSDARAEGLRLDPENRLLWRMGRTRLDFEALRDCLLSASGELDLQMGGKPVDLFAPPFAMRRALYGLIDRQFLPGTLRVFDVANPDQHSPERHLTTVPQQALFLMNSPFVVERARASLRRPEVAGAPDDRARVEALHRAFFERSATGRELEAATRFLSLSTRDVAEVASTSPKSWQYGFGEVDETSLRMKSFTPLPHFSGEAWQGGPAWPDRKLGWAQLTREGGHAGNDLSHAAVRRWLAPRAERVSIRGKIAHRHPEGDGVRCRIVSSRRGSLGEWRLHNTSAEVVIEGIEVEPGDTIDFVADMGGNLNNDDFLWAPVVQGAGPEWNAARDFSGPPLDQLTPWEEYAQALLLSNELVFVD